MQQNNILLLGLISLLIDMSTEMVYPLIPIYLTTVLGATPGIVGLIEGIAESLASLLKVGSGYLGDRYRHKKRLIFLGYSSTIVYKIMLLFAASWTGILAARILDRVGKGLRTAPRDALIAESARENRLGGSFGFHKMLDMFGSALGILIAYFLIGSQNYSFQGIFLISAVPAVLGVLLIPLLREKGAAGERKIPFAFSLRGIHPCFKWFLLIVFLFTLGNSSNAFLLLKAQDVGFSARQVILLYFLYNISASLLAYPLGRFSDKAGRRTVLISGYAISGAVYLGFATVTAKPGLGLLFLFYGAYTALASGAERALIAEIAPPDMRGTLLGMHATLVGIALLPASIIAGLLWDSFGPAAPFWFGGSLGFLASLAIALVLKPATDFRYCPK